MLVQTRDIGEKLIIENSIVITVLKISEGGVRLGIEAPIDIPVDRLEIYKKKQKFKASQ